MTRAIALSCPLCGGAVKPPIDDRRVACGYCGRKFHYAGEDFVPRLFLEPVQSDQDLQQAFFRALKSPLVPRDLRGRAVVLHKRRIFFPLYLVTGTRGGVLHTVKERVIHEYHPRHAPSDDGFATKFPGAAALENARSTVESSPDARVILGDFQYIYSAAAAEEWDFDGAALQDLARDSLASAVPAVLSDLARRGEVLEATIPVERVLEKGVASWRKGGGEGPEVLETAVRIVYLPLVEIVFRHGDHLHRILFEELAGTPLTGRLPFRRDMAFLAGIPVACATGFLLGKAARVLAFEPEWASGSAKDAVVLWFWFAAFGTFLFAGLLHLLWMFLRAPIDLEVMTGGGLKVRSDSSRADSPGAPFLHFLASAAETLIKGGRP